jgi:hypothetical protein
VAGPGDLFLVADELLEAAQAAVASTPSGGIARAFVSPGEPAYELCEQLSVHVGLVQQQASGDEPFQEMHRTPHLLYFVVPLTVVALRCFHLPGDRPATASELDAVSQVVYADQWAVWNTVHNRVAAGTLFGGCRGVAVGPSVPVSLQGQTSGHRLDVAVQVDGYA